MKKEFPSFMNDDSESDKYEVLVDFWLSWTLRCAGIKKITENNKKVHEYSKKILSYCITKKLDVQFLDNKKINKIKCWKYNSTEGGQKDLWFELNIDNINYALIFENKVYSELGEGQLEKYKLSVDKYYKNKDFRIIYIFFRAHDEYIKEDLKHCKKNNFVPILYSDLQDAIGTEELTNNYLFDEFWFRW